MIYHMVTQYSFGAYLFLHIVIFTQILYEVCQIRYFKPSLIYIKCFSIKIKTSSMPKPFGIN